MDDQTKPIDTFTVVDHVKYGLILLLILLALAVGSFFLFQYFFSA